MSRTKRFITGLLSSYAAIGFNIIYTVASVPLALHYLDKAEFGLWALVTQLAGYLMLLEFGMTGSIARSLADHKDTVETGIYGNILRTGARVFAIQGCAVGLLGIGLAWLAPPLLDLPDNLRRPFMVLMGSQSLISGIKLAMGSLASPLWCHQRIDLSNLASSLSLLVIFVIQWIGFHLGWHLYSLPIATSLGLVVSLFFIWHSCRRLGLYPPPQFRGQYDPKIFRELLHFGSGIFLLNLGAQMASASQVVVASRLLGMEAAATWSISTKIFTMAQQFVSRIIDSSAGGLAEMVVREEHYQLQNRYKDLVSISATMAALACTGIALMNGSYIEIWTSGRVFWNPWNDLVLAFVLFATSVTRCHTSLVGINKQIRGMKYIYLLEGIAFIGVSLLLVPWIGLTGLLISALVCNIGITGSYGISRTSDFFGITKSAVVSWIMRPALAVFFGACLFIVMRFHVIAGQEAITRFALAAMAFLIAILPVIWFFGLEPRIKLEVISLIKKICRSAKSRLGITC